MNLLDLPQADAVKTIADWVTQRGDPAYRGRQIVRYLWQRPAGDWTGATDLPSDLRTELEREFPLPRLSLARRQDSTDGTVKFLWRLEDGFAVESVWIPEGKRTTLCISSQAGCAFGCAFCATGRMGFQRHLAPWEIAGQVREMILDPAFGKPTNVVFMGMGEPLHNWSAVDQALTAFNAPDGFAIGARHITVSTIGLLPNLAKLAARPEQFRLAISLHASTSDRRAALMPVERKYNLGDLLEALGQFRRRVTFEYVMIAGANDTRDDALALADIATPLGALVNLLPLHPGGAPDLTPSSPAAIAAFAALLRTRGVNVTVRRSRGLDIAAACGQLRIEAGDLGGVGAQNHAHVQQ